MDGNSYTDTIQILAGTNSAAELHGRYIADDAPEQVLGDIFYLLAGILSISDGMGMIRCPWNKGGKQAMAAISEIW